MAKNDQKILKFLNKNSDLAPTITDMMIKLNISITDISDALAGLLQQGLVAKRNNEHGIECWYVASKSPAPMGIPRTVDPIPSPMVTPSPTPSPTSIPTPSVIPVQNPNPMPTARPQVSTSFEAKPNLAPNVAPMPLYPAPKGIGYFSLVVGLVIAIAFSTWLGMRLTHNELSHATKAFADQKSLTDATNTLRDFQEKTKAHVTALEEDVKKLTGRLDSLQGIADSLKTTVASPAPEKSSPKPLAKKSSRKH